MTCERETEDFDAELGECVAGPDIRAKCQAPEAAGDALGGRLAAAEPEVWQSCPVKREVAQRDRPADPGREAGVWRQEALSEVIEGEFAACDQSGEQGSGEDFTRLADFKSGADIDRRAPFRDHAGGGGQHGVALSPGGSDAAKGAVIDARHERAADGNRVEGWRGLRCRGRCANTEHRNQARADMSQNLRRNPNGHSTDFQGVREGREGASIHASGLYTKFVWWPNVGSSGVAAFTETAVVTDARLGGAQYRPYILQVMRRLSVRLGVLALVTAPLVAQLSAQVSATAQGQAVRWQDTLPPRAYWRLAMQAKAADSVGVRDAEWKAWAAAAPQTVAPRLALAILARADYRYVEGMNWLDSASRVASTPTWRNAIGRERISALLTRGEFTGVEAMLGDVSADTVGLPQSELADLRFVQLGYQRRVLQVTSIAAIDSVAAVAQPNDSVLHAKLTCLRAVADRARAQEYGESAIALATAAHVDGIAANCALVVGMQMANSAKSGLALQWFVKAEGMARAAHDDPTLAAALQYHGYVLTSLGYNRAARTRLTESIRVAQRIDDRNVEAWALLAVASGARQIGDAGTASSALRRSESLFAATGDKVGYENMLLEQAQSLIMLGDLAGAQRSGLRGLAAGESLHQPWMVLRSVYTLSDVAMRTNRLDEAAARLIEAQPLVDSIGINMQPQLTKYQGFLALRRGDVPSAIKLLKQARAAYVERQDLYRYIVDGALALAWLKSGDSVSAERTLIDANRELDAVRDTITVDRLRRVVMPPDSWGGTSGNLDEVLAAFVQSPRWLPTVFAVTERARSRALLNGALGAEGKMDSTAVAETRRRVRTSAAVLSEVQRALKPTTAMLIYAGGAAQARTSLMIVTKTSARGITLAPLDSLDRDIVRWLTLLESGEPGTGAGRRVSSALLASAMRGLPSSIKRVVIVPQGPLYRVPFHALPLGSGVLGDRVVVTVSPSVSLALAYAAEPRSVPARVLALGAGDTEVAGFIPQSLELNIERSDRGNPLAPLVAAADEARAAASWGRGSLALTGTNASESALKREAHVPYTVLHAAAHALTSDQALGANWLILRADSTDDGYVSGGELAELSAGRAMVVLSGCRTTGDFGSRGDAIDGLVAPLLARGVRTVVASHWAVSDRWTKVLMERFYQNLARGLTTAEAMNNAQTSLRREGVPARFWAAFSVIGDGALTFDPTPAPVGRH